MSMLAPHPQPHSIVSRLVVLVVVVAAAALVALVPATAGAATLPVHVKQAFGPIVGDVPAGVVCDFAYHEEDTGTQNTTRFFDAAGNLVRVEDEVAVTILHRNADTGLTLIEDLHYAAHVDFVSGEVNVTGQSWHLVDEEGRLVLGRGGLIAIDLATGDVIHETPQAMSEALCGLLGGAPAA
jgi:hypothetical protein